MPPGCGPNDGLLELVVRMHNGCGITSGSDIVADFGERRILGQAKRFKGALNTLLEKQVKRQHEDDGMDVDHLPAPTAPGPKSTIPKALVLKAAVLTSSVSPLPSPPILATPPAAPEHAAFPGTTSPSGTTSRIRRQFPPQFRRSGRWPYAERRRCDIKGFQADIVELPRHH